MATPLYIACQKGHTEVVAKLLAANASVDQADNAGVTPLYLACQNGHLGVVQLLSSYGASRTFDFDAPADTAEHVATDAATTNVAAWLVLQPQLDDGRSTTSRSSRPSARSRCCAPAPTSTPPPSSAETAGEADAARPREGHAVPLAADAARAGSAAHVVLEWGAPWSRQTHRFYPPAVRARVAELMRVAQAIKRGKAAYLIDGVRVDFATRGRWSPTPSRRR